MTTCHGSSLIVYREHCHFRELHRELESTKKRLQIILREKSDLEYMKNESERKSHGLEDDLKRAQQELNTMEKELNTMKKELNTMEKHVNELEFVREERDLKFERELEKKEEQISDLKAELEHSNDNREVLKNSSSRYSKLKFQKNHGIKKIVGFQSWGSF